MGWDTDTVVILADHLDTPEMIEKFAEMVVMIRENALSIDTGVYSDVVDSDRSGNEASEEGGGAAGGGGEAQAVDAARSGGSVLCVCVLFEV